MNCSVYPFTHSFTVSSCKYAPHYAHYFEAKLVRDVCSNIQLVSCIQPLAMLATLKVDNHDDCSDSGKMASSFTEHVLWEINSLILSWEASKQLAISMGWDNPAYAHTASNENLGGDHYSVFVCSDFREAAGCFLDVFCSRHDYCRVSLWKIGGVCTRLIECLSKCPLPSKQCAKRGVYLWELMVYNFHIAQLFHSPHSMRPAPGSWVRCVTTSHNFVMLRMHTGIITAMLQL